MEFLEFIISNLPTINCFSNIRIEYSCKECIYKRCDIEVISSFKLDLIEESNLSIQNLLNRYNNPELLSAYVNCKNIDGSDRFICKETRSPLFVSPIFIIQLKRFNNNGYNTFRRNEIVQINQKIGK